MRGAPDHGAGWESGIEAVTRALGRIAPDGVNGFVLDAVVAGKLGVHPAELAPVFEAGRRVRALQFTLESHPARGTCAWVRVTPPGEVPP